MEHDLWSINLPQTAAAWRAGRTDRLEAALLHELTEQAPDLLIDCCNAGGWPHDEEVVVADIALQPDRLIARITVHFVEVISSGCKDLPNRENRQLDLVLTIEQQDDFAVISHSDADPDQWDLLDRNSAADGA